MNLLPPAPGRLRLPAELLAVAPAAPVTPVRDVVSEAQAQLPRAVPAGGGIAEALPGAQLRIVRVIERLADDAYRVAIEGRSLAVKLAGDHEPGRVLALAFPEPLPDGEPELRISSAARTALALGPAAGEGESLPGAVLEPMVLVVDAPEAATTLAGELAGRIVSSGLFYESHLADWAEGRRPREELEREPQARFAAQADEASGAVITGEAKPLPAPLEPLVREQLAALERHEARFALPLGEGRPAELIVSHERARPGVTSEGAWTTRLRLDLPSLGEVNVRLRLMGRSVSLDLEAEDAMTDALAESAQALRSRLAGHDLSIVRLVISSHG